MRHGRLLYILGDVHGNFNALNRFIDAEIRQDRNLRTVAPYWEKDGDDLRVIILQAGDFAYFWPFYNRTGEINNQIDCLTQKHVPIYWCGGNHDDWDELNRLESSLNPFAPIEVESGICYCPFGSTLQISPDITVMFAGGAESVDREWRLSAMARGAPKCWWKQEGVQESDMERLADVPHADWIVSHTAPAAFHVGQFQSSPSRECLDIVLQKYEPRQWFFGHFHVHAEGFSPYGKKGLEPPRWECLDIFNRGEGGFRKIWLDWGD